MAARPALLLLVVCTMACMLPTPWISAPAAAVLVLWLPGRQLVRLLPGMGALPGRAWSSMAASLVLMPIPLSWLWWLTNDRVAVVVAVAAINAVLIAFAARAPYEPAPPAMFPSSRSRRVFALIVTWVAGWVLGCFVIPEFHPRPSNTPAEDYIKHHAVLWSLGESTLPLRNIFYAGEPDTPHYYYEYFYLIPAAVRKMTGDSVPIAVVFGASAAALASMFLALVYLLARAIIGSASGALVAAACASVACGWDAVAVAVRLLSGRSPLVILDAWCPPAWRINNLMNTFLWCPQHVAAVVALLLCGWWLRHAPRATWWLVMGPLLGTAVFGLSVYQAMVFFSAAGVYVLLELRWAASMGREAFRRMLGALVVVVSLGVALMSVKAWHYYIMSGRYPGGLTVQWARFPLAVFGRFVAPGPLANFLDAPWMIVVDMGLGAVALVAVSPDMWRRLVGDPATRLLLIAGVVGTLAQFSIRSDVNAIDYGFSLGMMGLMIIGGVCAGEWLDGVGVRPWAARRRRVMVTVGVLLGLPVGIWEAPATTLRTVLQEKKVRIDDPAAVLFLRDETPHDAVVQCDPFDRMAIPQRIDRQMGVLDPENPHVVVFQGVDRARMERALADVEAAFSTDSSRTAYEKLHALGITHVLAGTPERRRYGALEQFGDPALFHVAFQNDDAVVYRLADGEVARDR
ncbi:MAG: hypothetical protein ACE5E6_01610 [Phycisphaerae bacterium]